MPYQPYYNVVDWQNLPSQKTALSRTNLLHAENGIKEADNRIVQLDQRKAEQSTVNAMVSNVTLDPKTGVLTVSLLNGSIVTYDLDIERVVLNFDITDDNVLVLTLADGTRKEVDLTKLVNIFSSTTTISMQVKDRVVKADIIDGSVTMNKLDPDIQTEFRQYMLDAQAARDAALQYQGFAKRYGVGDEAAYPGSGTDNAKYYYEGSKTNADTTSSNAQTATKAAGTATEQAATATQKASSASASATSAAGDAQIARAKATEAAASEQVSRDKAAEAAASEQVARAKAIESAGSAKSSERYAIGGVLPEDTEDNAKWYYQRCKTLKDEIDATAELVVPQFYIDFATGQLMSDKAAQGIRFWIEDGNFYGEMEVTA